MNIKQKTYLLLALLVLILGGVAAVGMLVQAKSPFLMDNTDGGYIEEGNWKTVRRIGYRKNERVGESTESTSAQAQWTFTSIPRGAYDVFATWQVADSAKSEPDSEATFTIENGEKHLASISVNQAENSTGSRYKNVWWQKLGTWDVRSPQVTIHLSPSAPSRSIFADAILLRRHKEQTIRGTPSVQVPVPLVSTGSRMAPPVPRPSIGARTTPSPTPSGASSGNAPAAPITPGTYPTANSSTPSTSPSSPAGPHPTLTGTGSVSSASGSRVSSSSGGGNDPGFTWIKVSNITPSSATFEWKTEAPTLSILEIKESGQPYDATIVVREEYTTEHSFSLSQQGSSYRLWPGTTYSFRISTTDRNGVMVKSAYQTFQSLPAEFAPGNTSLSLQRLFVGQYNNTKYSFVLKDPDGFRNLSVKKVNGTAIMGGSGGCGNTTIESTTITLDPTDFPIIALVEDCAGNFARVQADMPPIGETASSSSATITSSSASSSNDVSFSVNRATGTTGDYIYTVTASTAGLDTVLLKRADGTQSTGNWTYYCRTASPNTTSGGSFHPSDVPITVTVTTCGGVTSTFTVSSPP